MSKVSRRSLDPFCVASAKRIAQTPAPSAGSSYFIYVVEKPTQTSQLPEGRGRDFKAIPQKDS